MLSPPFNFHFLQNNCGVFVGEWWVLLLKGAMGEWERTAVARSLRGLLDGDHMRCFEQFHASEEERDVIEEWRKRAGRR